MTVSNSDHQVGGVQDQTSPAPSALKQSIVPFVVPDAISDPHEGNLATPMTAISSRVGSNHNCSKSLGVSSVGSAHSTICGLSM